MKSDLLSEINLNYLCKVVSHNMLNNNHFIAVMVAISFQTHIFFFVILTLQDCAAMQIRVRESENVKTR